MPRSNPVRQRENCRRSSQALFIVLRVPRVYLSKWLCLSKKQRGHWPAWKLVQRAEHCQITARLTTGHFKQAAKGNRGTQNPHEFTVQATFHVSVIPWKHTNLPPSLLPKKNKQSTLTNHSGKPSVNLTKPLQLLWREATSNLKLTHTSSLTTLRLGSCRRLHCVVWDPDRSNQQGPPLAKINLTGATHLKAELRLPVEHQTGRFAGFLSSLGRSADVLE